MLKLKHYAKAASVEYSVPQPRSGGI